MLILSFVSLLIACVLFGAAAFSHYFRGPVSPSPYPWYGGLVTLGLFLWSLSEVILRWPR
jgi:hypothetical protein